MAEVTPPLIEPAVQNIRSTLMNFSLNSYQQLSANNKGKNVFYSPLSVMALMAEVSNGAKNETQTQIRSLLSSSASGETSVNDGFYSLFQSLNRSDRQYQLSFSSGIWVDNSYKLLPGFTDVVTKKYLAEVKNVDFVKNAEAQRNDINSWVASKTNNKITELFVQGSLDSSTRMAVANAIYFKADWMVGFDKGDTRKEGFTLSNGEQVGVGMMHRSESETEKVRYIENADYQMIQLPYKGEDMAMYIFLPRTNDIAGFEKKITTQLLETDLPEANLEKVRISLPKFKFDTQYNLIPIMESLGVTDAFSDSKADFSGIGGSADLFISVLTHKAYIDVNEEGTEAAAATGGGFTITSMPLEPDYKVFRADHPFFFVIKGGGSDSTILFMGKVENPS